MKGWTLPVGLGAGAPRKWHYFVDAAKDRTSLCGKWAIMKPQPRLFDDSNDESPDNCALCRKRVRTMREKQGGKKVKK